MVVSHLRDHSPLTTVGTEQNAFARAITPGFPGGRGHSRVFYTSISIEIVC